MVLMQHLNSKIDSATLLDEKDIANIRSKNLHYELLFQVSIHGNGWDACFTIALWKTSDSENPLIIQIEHNEDRYKCLNGFDDPWSSNEPKDVLKTKSIADFVYFIKAMNLTKPDFIAPVLVAAFEGEGKEIYLHKRYSKSDKHLLKGGSCFGMMVEGEKDWSVDSKITKKQHLSERAQLINMSMGFGEAYRNQHVWVLTSPGEYILENISEIFQKKSLEKAVQRESGYRFENMPKWAEELNSACTSFHNQHGYWPNIILASTITYKRIDLVANTKQGNIKGDGSAGMPIIPDGFVSLSGFQGENYSLDMCVDENLPELSFKLVYDSDPDGEFVEDESERYLDAESC